MAETVFSTRNCAGSFLRLYQIDCICAENFFCKLLSFNFDISLSNILYGWNSIAFVSIKLCSTFSGYDLANDTYK